MESDWLTIACVTKTWEHYSSIRNINGPMTGLPNVQPILPTPQDAASVTTPPKHTNVDPWKVKAVIGFLPHLIEEAAIIEALEHNGSDINSAVSMLLDAEYISSQSSSASSLSTARSSSIERDSDSDDDEIYPPSKRQNRTTKTERFLLKENDIPQVQKACSPDTSGAEQGAGSDDEVSQGSHNRKSRIIKTGKPFRKDDGKKRITTQIKATNTSDSTCSESEAESGRHRSNNGIIKQATVNSSGAKGDDSDVRLSPHPTEAKAKRTTGQPKEDNDGDIGPTSESEADDEYQPEADEDVASDFMPTTGAPAFRDSSLHDQQMNPLNTMKIQKHAHKDGKRAKPSGKLLGRAIKNLNRSHIPSPIEKVVGMKVLFI
jgi:hypothetical protein